MLRLLHRLCTLPVDIQRALVHRVKELLYVPDGYYSMGQIYRKIKPAAILDIGAHHGHTVDKLLDYAPGAKVHAFEPYPAKRGHPPPTDEQATQCARARDGAGQIKTGMTRFHLNAGEQTNSLLEIFTQLRSGRFTSVSPKFRCRR